MCGRYAIARAAGDLLGGVELEESIAEYNVAPTRTVPILVDHPGESPGTWRREIHAARWGLLPGWAPEESFSQRTFNARSETAAQKPAFRHAVRSQRCAVPANGYYEWKKRTTPEGRIARTPYYVHPRDETENIYFAGLYEWWRIPSGASAGSWLLSTTILTMPAPSATDAALAERGTATLEELSVLHDRLPIPLRHAPAVQQEPVTAPSGAASAGTISDDPAGDGLTRWLRGSARNQDEAQEQLALLRAEAYDVAADWALREVGPEVGNVAHQGPQLCAPAHTLL